MPLSWNEIKDRAFRFSNEWEGESRERAEKDSFWNDFFDIFGISRRRVASFEEPVKKLDNKQGFISDYRYSKNIVYNNYPWPQFPSAKHRQAVEVKAQHVLDVRADLYDPLTMPPKLVKAHAAEAGESPCRVGSGGGRMLSPGSLCQ